MTKKVINRNKIQYKNKSNISYSNGFERQIKKKLQLGLDFHNRGQLGQAKVIYEEILKLNSKNFDALYLLGTIAAQTKQWNKALKLMDDAISEEKTNAYVYNNRGNVLKELNHLERALESYDKAIDLKNNYAQAYFNRGVVQHQIGYLEEAIWSYTKAIEFNTGDAQAYLNRGIIFQQQGHLDKALESYDKAIKIENSYYEAYTNRGNVLKELNRIEEALESYDKAIQLKFDYSAAFYNRGVLLQELNLLGPALESYDKAIEFNPDYAQALNNRGVVLQELNLLSSALESYDKAIGLRNDYAEAHSNRGNLLRELKLLDDALLSYEKAISLKHEFADAHWNKSLTLLLQNKFLEGFIEYEWRWKNKKLVHYKEKRLFSQMLWLGDASLANKTILLWSEQGLGDTIQFCRYCKLVKGLGARVILEVPKSLIALLESLEGVDILIEKGKPIPEFDYQCPLLSLPLAFQTTTETIPSTFKYIKCDVNNINLWQSKLGLKAKPRLGVVWSSVSTFKADSARSIHLSQMLKALPIDKYEIICLQKEIKMQDKLVFEESGLSFYGDELKDFSDTAALIECVDLVVSTCTSVPHLSAALGKPTWLLLQYIPDWRWMLDRTDSPWYPSVRIYRQKTSGDWDRVCKSVYEDLLNFNP